MCELILVPLQGEINEMNRVQEIIESAPELYMALTNYPPGQAENATFYSSLPTGKSYEDKFAFAIIRKNKIVGIIDVIRGYPQFNIAEIGLLIIDSPERLNGIGQMAIIKLTKIVKTWPSIDYLRVEIPTRLNTVLKFWEKIGFLPTNQKRIYKYSHIECLQYEFLKKI